ncbi:MAG: LPXTG cell wall anchor domain-containing protein [Candidatus Saccharicenans sp.]
MIKKALLLMLILVILASIVSSMVFAADDFGPKGKGKGHGGRHGVAEPLSIALVGIGLAGLGAYALTRRKKN